jgi:hypothetical protein
MRKPKGDPYPAQEAVEEYQGAANKRDLPQAPHAFICPDLEWGYPRERTIEK